MFLAYPTLNQLWSVKAFLFSAAIHILRKKGVGYLEISDYIAPSHAKKTQPTDFYRYVFMEKRDTEGSLTPLLSDYHYMEKHRDEIKQEWDCETFQSEHSLGLKLPEFLPSKTPHCLHGFSKWILLLGTGEVTWWEMCHCWASLSRAPTHLMRLCILPTSQIHT